MAKQMNKNLTKEQKDILFKKGTEAPFSGQYVNHNKAGMYTCVNCGAKLFSSSSKFESKEPGLAGWPSFAEVAKSDAVELKDDSSLGVHRVEVLCKNCGAHLGHLFEGVKDHPSGVHYCINSACLGFKPDK
ncbi:peptide-methionine (R)-S-oxide reductase [Candidatus Saccharibacteria bacterium RIFCSPHIGHO2_12_FULL_47_16b]|nr:MAG: peptide-methionine (R)-S-oxide reductase [Candidatus Saccharibacteria bacterium RIFCSPHIGHO2_12_FULL_47_16b]OGL40536.1 MAG: peptide-methionine (R)-S-oxide reductase [Candidatus Saccharibacteria bacterium RIFCSPLOWO2_02_FULL_46_7]